MLERLRCKMTDREEFKKWYKTTNKGELSRFEIWQARGELDAVRIKELEAKLDKVKRTLFFEQRWHATIQACKEALEQPKKKKYLYAHSYDGLIVWSETNLNVPDRFTFVGKIEVQND